MTSVQVESGICGFATVVRASKAGKKTVKITIISDCEKVAAMGDRLPELGMMDVLKNPIDRNPVYQKAGECRLHASCPVPCGLIKAAEVELGLALVRDVKIRFQNDS